MAPMSSDRSWPMAASISFTIARADRWVSQNRISKTLLGNLQEESELSFSMLNAIDRKRLAQFYGHSQLKYTKIVAIIGA